jgi:hypothetical protein
LVYEKTYFLKAGFELTIPGNVLRSYLALTDRENLQASIEAGLTGLWIPRNGLFGTPMDGSE